RRLLGHLLGIGIPGSKRLDLAWASSRCLSCRKPIRKKWMRARMDASATQPFEDARITLARRHCLSHSAVAKGRDAKGAGLVTVGDGAPPPSSLDGCSAGAARPAQVRQSAAA